MKGKKNEKKVEINDATVNSMGGKKCYMEIHIFHYILIAITLVMYTSVLQI